ncbi:MAG: PAS domain-containing protein [Methylotenera sp.]|nr:PAS domain-containing protein [Oligoflexia bacterium]
MSVVNYQHLFESVPTSYLVLSPDFTILSVTDAYCRETRTIREELVGQNLFQLLPTNADHRQADGLQQLRTSFEKVLRLKKPVLERGQCTSSERGRRSRIHHSPDRRRD